MSAAPRASADGARRAGLPLRLLWLRHFHPYLWTHAPLCRAYAPETIRLGRWWLCRSCTAALMGAAMALALCLLLNRDPAPGGATGAAAAVGAALALAPLSVWAHRFALGGSTAAPGREARPTARRPRDPAHRAARDWSRFALGLAAGVLLAAPALLGARGLLGWAALVLVILLARRLAARPAWQPAVDQCRVCPHCDETTACPGFARQVAALKAFSRASGEPRRPGGMPLLAMHPPVPDARATPVNGFVRGRLRDGTETGTGR